MIEERAALSVADDKEPIVLRVLIVIPQDAPPFGREELAIRTRYAVGNLYLSTLIHRLVFTLLIFVRTERNSETSGSVFDDFGINARRRRRSMLVGKLRVFTAALPLVQEEQSGRRPFLLEDRGASPREP